MDYLGITDYKITSCITQKRKSHFHQHDNVLVAQIEMEPMYEVSIEVQLNNPEKLNPHRIRFELGSDDVSFLQEGMDYSDLPNKIFIVFSKKDLNNSGLPIITIKRTIQETGQVFEDGQTIVYLNLENITDDDNPINNLISDLFEPDYHKIKNSDIKKWLVK